MSKVAREAAGMNPLGPGKKEQVFLPNALKSGLEVLLIGVPFITFFFIAFFGTGDYSLFGVIIIMAAVFFAMAVAEYIRMRFEEYSITDRGVVVQKGVIWKSHGTLPYNQIQDIEIVQGLSDRILGLGNLSVSTMSTVEALKKIDLSDAETLKAELRQRMSKMTNGALKNQETQTDVNQPFEIQTVRKFWAVAVFEAAIVAAIIMGMIIVFNVKNQILQFFLVGGILPVILALTLFAMLQWQPLVYSLATKFSLEKDGILLHYSFLQKASKRFPFAKIQDIILKQSPFDRILNLAGVMIETGAEEILSSNRNDRDTRKVMGNLIPNLDLSDARELVSKIISRSGIRVLETCDLRKEFPLQKRKIIKKAIWTWLFALIVIGIAGAGFISSFTKSAQAVRGIPVLTGILLSMMIATIIGVFLLALIYEWAYFNRYAYRDNISVLSLKKGVFWVSELMIPYSKIEHIFVDQDFLDRLFGLYDVHVSSAGTTGMQLHIDGVEKETAERLKEHLMDRTKRRPT